MYRISTHKRKHSATPIVKVTVGADGKEKEDIVLMTSLKRDEGNVLLESIVEFLNKDVAPKYKCDMKGAGFCPHEFLVGYCGYEYSCLNKISV